MDIGKVKTCLEGFGMVGLAGPESLCGGVLGNKD